MMVKLQQFTLHPLSDTEVVSQHRYLKHSLVDGIFSHAGLLKCD